MVSAWRNRDRLQPLAATRESFTLPSSPLEPASGKLHSWRRAGEGEALWAAGGLWIGLLRSSNDKCPLENDKTKRTAWHFRHRGMGTQQKSCLVFRATSVRQTGWPGTLCQLIYKILTLERWLWWQDMKSSKLGPEITLSHLTIQAWSWIPAGVVAAECRAVWSGLCLPGESYLVGTVIYNQMLQAAAFPPSRRTTCQHFVTKCPTMLITVYLASRNTHAVPGCAYQNTA